MKERAYPVYTVNKHAEGLLVGGHPWAYENDILYAPDTEPENGALADVVSPKGAYLGTGFVSLHSKIRVRLISRNANDTFDAAFWRRRVEYAWAYRKTVLEPADLTACRVIFGEADQFPGLTVDRFNNILVTQTLSVGMEKLKPVLFPLLAEDDPAGREVGRLEDGLAVGPGVLDAAAPEAGVEGVVGVAGDEADADLALERDEAGAEVSALRAHYVGEGAVLGLCLRELEDVVLVHPRMPAHEAGLGFFVYFINRIAAF